MRIRKEKMLARKRDRRLLAEGKLRPEQVCLALNARMDPKPPLVLSRVHLEQDWLLDEDRSV
jgi:hypothetical protein